MVDLYRLRLKRIEAGIIREVSNQDQSQIFKFKPVLKDEKTHVDNLNKEFTDSLGAFDEFILQELSKIDQETSAPLEEQELSGLAGEAAAAVQRLASKGIDLALNTGADRTVDNFPENQSLTKQIKIPAGTGGEEGTSRAIATPAANIESIVDDDIVARQLREAAEKEIDPVLKEKLWREYNAYKHAVRRQLPPVSGKGSGNFNDKN